MLILCYAGLVIGIVIGLIGWLCVEADEAIGFFPLIIGAILIVLSLWGVSKINPEKGAVIRNEIVKEL